MRWVSLWLLCCTCCWAADYDAAFKRWGRWYFPFEDWRWFRAQGMAESGINQSARSGVGAIGVMQIMPATGEERGCNLYEATANIQCGIAYDRWLWERWKPLDGLDRLLHSLGSYNAGLGHILRAWRVERGGWDRTAAALPGVTGRHAAETINYVRRIQAFREGVK